MAWTTHTKHAPLKGAKNLSAQKRYARDITSNSATAKNYTLYVAEPPKAQQIAHSMGATALITLRAFAKPIGFNEMAGNRSTA